MTVDAATQILTLESTVDAKDYDDSLALVVEDNEDHRRAIVKAIKSAKHGRWNILTFTGPFDVQSILTWLKQCLQSRGQYQRCCLFVDLSWYPKGSHVEPKDDMFLNTLLCPEHLQLYLPTERLAHGMELLLNKEVRRVLENVFVIAVSSFGLGTMKSLCRLIGAHGVIQKHPVLDAFWKNGPTDKRIHGLDKPSRLNVLKIEHASLLSQRLESFIQDLYYHGLIAHDPGGAYTVDYQELGTKQPLVGSLVKIRRLLHLRREDDDEDIGIDVDALTQDVGGFVHCLVEYPERDSHIASLLELKARAEALREENVQLRQRLEAENQIVGASRGMQRVAEEIARAAPNNATVLIRGESGVGKELVARAVHFSSPRRRGPFVCINCAALSETLLESELFGHEKGAFTGAVGRKIGKFEASHQGTIMLDEIGEMSPSIQAKFLRILEGHPFERVGGAEPIKVDVRVIAATNRNLEKAVTDGIFRRDLYFRLHVLEILVPPLRKRPEDIPELANYFFHRFTGETGRKLKGFTPPAMEQMLRYRWPGNVRELKNVVERAIVLAAGDYIEDGDLSLSKLPTDGEGAQGTSTQFAFPTINLDEVERLCVLEAIRRTKGDRNAAAVLLGCGVTTVYNKLKSYGDPESASS